MRSTTVEIAGRHFHVRPSAAAQDRNIVEEVYLRDGYGLRHLARALPSPPAVVLDVGAHIGSFAVLAKECFPAARVYAYEPADESSTLCARNLEGMSHCHVERRAVAYGAGRTCLLGGVGSTGGSMLMTPEEAERVVAATDRPPGERDVRVVVDEGARVGTHPTTHRDNERYFVLHDDVPTTTLEEVRRRHDLERIGLLKLDCEGSEIDILQHMSPETVAAVDAVIGEYHVAGGWEAFLRVACARFPHLVFRGGGAEHIGLFVGASPDVASRLPEPWPPRPSAERRRHGLGVRWKRLLRRARGRGRERPASPGDGPSD